MMSDDPFRHKWWGWGPAGVVFDMSGRPDFEAFIESKGLSIAKTLTPRVARSDIRLPERRCAPALERALSELLGERLRTDEDDRLTHAFGRSYRDLVRLRSGLVERAPDLVAYPASHEDVERIIALCVEHGACLIPFGGGTNVVGSLEPDAGVRRPVVTLDLRHMNRLISLDEEAMTAELESGMFGPQIEEALNARGFSLGHHPDSFLYSTLGGWIATRSAGTHSNRYGKIEDMVVALRVVTPTGTLVTKPLPAASNGPDLNRMLVGSEGVLGVITRATMRVHPLPEHEEYRMVLFPSFREGLEALRECVRRGAMPSMARLSDESETEMIFAAKPPETGLRRKLEAPVKRWFKRHGYERPAALVVAFEGPKEPALHQRKVVRRILQAHRGFDLGTGPGEAWKKSRYDVPYLRDFMMDYGVIADSFDTAAVWSELWPLYEHVTRVFEKTIELVTGRPGYVGSHVSHLYETGACLYYTFAASPVDSLEPSVLMDRYGAIKEAVTEAILFCGGALSHHHAVGREHQAWIEEELSTTGVRTLRAVKRELDPDGLLNPGSLIPPEE